MAKKIIKGTIGKLGVFGKKKKAAAPAEGQPIITPLGQEETFIQRRRARASAQVRTILEQSLGPDGRGKLGG